MRVVVMGLAALLAGCSDNGAEAERRYQMVSQTGSKAEKCDEARRVEGVYLDLHNDEKYREWRKTRETECLFAEIDARSRIIR
jgi:hypothetical protein